MRNYRLIAVCITTPLIILLGALIYAVFYDQVARLLAESKIAATLFFLLIAAVWKVVYRFFCKLFSRNKPRPRQKIEDLLQQNIRFVLLLRPFTHDKQLEAYTKNEFDPLIGFSTAYSTIEEQISDSFSAFGLRTIAIADNKEMNTYLGFERYLADNDTWKETVTTLIKRARYICLYGNGEGEFQWELQQLINLKCRQKCIILYPDTRTDFESFLTTYRALGIDTTELTQKKTSSTGTATFGGIIYYNQAFAKFDLFSFANVDTGVLQKNDVKSKIGAFFKHLQALPPVILKRVTPKIHFYSLLIDLLCLSLWILLYYLCEEEEIESFSEVMIPPSLLYLITGLVPGNLIFSLIVGDKTGIHAKGGQKMFRRLIVFFCILIPHVVLVYFIIFLAGSLITKRTYLPHEEFSGTALLVRQKKPKPVAKT